MANNVIENVEKEIIDKEIEKKHKCNFYAVLEAEEAEQLLKDEKERKKRMRYFKAVEYNNLIKEIEEATAQTSKKTPRQYNLLKTYEIYNIGDTKKIIARRKGDSNEANCESEIK
jgi:hypothetical protein